MKNITKYAAILLLIVMAALIALSGTYAKYTSLVAGEDSAIVAKWNIVVDGERLTTQQASFAEFDLFSTLIDTTDGTSAETDVTAEKIAPGTQGKFSFEVKNSSEVTAQYKVNYTLTNDAGVPIEFSVDNGTTWTTALQSTNFKTLGDTEETVTVMWRWAFTGDASSNYTTTQTDATDTTLGLDTDDLEVKVKVELVVEQVN